MTKIKVNHGIYNREFSNDPKLSLLEQMLVNAAPVSFSCLRGDCGQCAVNLIQGEIAPKDASKPLWRAGAVLSCNALANSELTIEIPYDPELEGVEVRRSPVKIHELNRLSSDVMEVVVRLPPTNEIRFLPGQYVRVTNREGTVRSYSLAAGPAVDRRLRMHIRKVEDGQFSQWLFKRAVLNELLHVEGPYGRFFLRRKYQVRQSVFLATGTGIAPIWAMLSAASEEQIERMGEVVIYWGNRVRLDAYMSQQLEEISLRRNFRFLAIFSQDENEPGVVHKYVQHQMLHENKELSAIQVFACGNPAMIESARALVIAAGLPAERFHCDPFTAS